MKHMLSFGIELVAWLLLAAPVTLFLTELSKRIGVDATAFVMILLMGGVFWVIVQVGRIADSLLGIRRLE